MDAVARRSAPSALRLLGLSLLAALAWVILSLTFSTTSASANDDSPSGLLGTISGAVDDTTGAVKGLVGSVDDTVASVVEAVEPVTAPVAAVVPEPVRQPVAEVTQTTVDAVNTVVGHVDETAASAVDTVTETVSQVAEAEVVGAVVHPVVETVVSVPVVGGVVSEVGLDDVLTGVADTLDEVVPAVVGTPAPTGPLLPTIPGGTVDEVVDTVAPSVPAQPTPGIPPVDGTAVAAQPESTDATVPTAAVAVERSLAERVRAAAAAFTASTSPSPGESSAHVGGSPAPAGSPVTHDLGDGIPGSSSASVTSGGSAPAAARLDDRTGSPTFVLLSRSALVDDDLPGAPTFATDVSPD